MAFRPSSTAKLKVPDAVTAPPREGAREVLRRMQTAGAENQEEERRRQAARSIPFYDWALAVPEAKAGVLDFDRFTFQRELYDEHAADDREQVYEKATQVGVSTQAIRWVMYHADVRAGVALYTFPTKDELGDFSRQRIKPVLRSSEYLQSRMEQGAIDNVSQKQIGPGWVYFRGTEKPIDSVDADVVVFDEYDSSDQLNIDASERRVTGPMSTGLIRRVGVPTVPGFGIAALYEETDQRVWVVKCKRCRKQNPMRGWDAFEANVDVKKATLVCSKCRKPLDVRVGEWVATFPDRDVRGYHLPKLIVHGVRLDLIIRNSRKKKPLERQQFHNRDLGEAYAPAEGRLSLEQVQACQRPGELHLLEGLTTHNLVTMGVDVASQRAINVRISEHLDEYRKRTVYLAEVEDDANGTAYQKLCRLMEAFGVNMAAIDHLPEGRFANAFTRKFPGRAYRVAYRDDRHAARAQKKMETPLEADDEEHFASIPRSMAIDTTLELFRRQWVLIPDLDELPVDYAAQLGNAVKQQEEDERGNVQVWYARTGADDWLQAEVYDVVATELFYRQAGLEAVQLATTQPTATGDEWLDRPTNLDEDDTTYREGPSDDFG